MAQSVNDTGVNQPSTFQGFGNRAAIGTVSFTGTEATMSPRFFRSGTPGDVCSTFSSGNFQYQQIQLFTDNSGSLTATFDPLTCGTGTFVSFHSSAFNPASICDDYVWSFGSSQAFTETFAVARNRPLYMVVSGVANAPGVVCGPQNFNIQGANLGGPPAPREPVPANDFNTLALLAALVLLVGSIVVARARH